MNLNPAKRIRELEKSVEVSRKMGKLWKRKCFQYRLQTAELAVSLANACEEIINATFSFEDGLSQHGQVAMGENNQVVGLYFRGEDAILAVLRSTKRIHHGSETLLSLLRDTTEAVNVEKEGGQPRPSHLRLVLSQNPTLAPPATPPSR